MIGTTISHYRVVGKLGEGGMGVVYLAEDIVLGRRVAIKTLGTNTGGEDQHFRARFLREARSVSALSHPHIATIYDYGESETDMPYIVMELIEGPDPGRSDSPGIADFTPHHHDYPAGGSSARRSSPSGHHSSGH